LCITAKAKLQVFCHCIRQLRLVLTRPFTNHLQQHTNAHRDLIQRLYQTLS